MDNQIQTLVVHVDQLTDSNMLQLGQAGYRVLRDPNFLIFARQVPPQDLPNGSGGDPAESNNNEEVIDVEPIPMPQQQQSPRNKRK